MSVSLKELAAILDTIRQFLKPYDRAVKLPLYIWPKPKKEIGFTLSKDELLAHFFQGFKERCNRQIRFIFHSERNNECCFSIKKFPIDGEQNVLKEIINLRHCKVYSFYKICYYIAAKCAIFDSNYGMWLKHFCQVIYQDQSIVEFTGMWFVQKRNVEAKCAYT